MNRILSPRGIALLGMMNLPLDISHDDECLTHKIVVVDPIQCFVLLLSVTAVCILISLSDN